MPRDPRPWISALRSSQDHLRALVEPLSPEQVEASSRAREWTIAQVMSHLGSQAEIFGAILDAALEHRPLPGPDAFPPVWDAWNARGVVDQAADSLAVNESFVRRVEGLSDAQLGTLHFAMFGMEFDAVGFLQMRLSEHAVHTWDVAASLDPSAQVSTGAVALLVDTLPDLARRVGTPQGASIRLRITTTDPVRQLLLVVDDEVRIERSDGGSADGLLRLPAEALLRLVYGRLDDEHTPPIEFAADGMTLDTLRSVFPGV
ncbi:MAG TPA: maleylpyruvate isomerase family mycothiol-dependent enzyme [Acidimicrobiales bacterium]|nr:maleylpyruvate isomerase family mycothiol-dependent enzyme [Acidimicrobiales bacterium]